MSIDTSNTYRFRLDFGKMPNFIDVPELLGVQTRSFHKFLQADVPPEERLDEGLQAVFQSIFPITDFSNNYKLDFLHYEVGVPKYSEKESRSRGITYSVPIRLNLRLFHFDRNSTEEPRIILEAKDQEIYLGDFPMMTERGSFIVNGTERVIVSQLHKSPGVFFSSDRTKSLASKPAISASIIPQRGSWVDFEFDQKNMFYVRFDRKKKMLATVFFKALGYSEEDILRIFYVSESIDLEQAVGKKEQDRVYYKSVDPKTTLNQKALKDIVHPSSGELLVPVGRKITKNHLRKIVDAGLTQIPTLEEDLIGRVALTNICDAKGDVLLEVNHTLTKDVLETLLSENVTKIKLIYIGRHTVGSSLRETLAVDKMQSSEEALLELYKKLRPGDVPLLDAAKNLLHNMFFNPDRYDLSQVGRLKLNRKVGFSQTNTSRVLSKDDILEVAKYLLHLKENIGTIDDIDHLGNRRVRAVGELIENRFRAGLLRTEKGIKEKMSLNSDESLNITDIVNTKPLLAVVNEFFGSSQLSQFMDQTNPLSEITHKRRLSALGPGGLARDRAGFEVRDVHNSHYGRICPIETPEGPNIGLISSLACFSKINPYGFIETPYRKVREGVISDEVVYLSAVEDDLSKVAQSNVLQKSADTLEGDFVSARIGGEFRVLPSKEIEYIDLSPKQLVSVAASLVPFLEHDDANRSLMGANMQRQAVPVIKAQAPLVGTGMEFRVAKDSGTCLIAKRDGIVDSVDASRIVVRSGDDGKKNIENKVGVDIYHLEKYDRSNQNTCIDQRPVVTAGMKIHAGQVLADGACTEMGELALGQNMLIAFMPWNGYNYEDSILVSERVLAEDRFTSVHIEEMECLARDTKLGNEQITADLPNVSEYMLRNLDQTGVVLVGSYVKTGDILVGKVTPKGEAYVNPEEKLLRAIFGEKAGDVRDSSLKVPQGIEGVVIDVKMFNRRGLEKDARALEIERDNLQKIDEDFRDEVRILNHYFCKQILPYAKKGALKKDLINPRSGEVLFAAGTKLSKVALESLPVEIWSDIRLDLGKKDTATMQQTIAELVKQIQTINEHYEEKIQKETRQDDLPPGVIRSVKVYIAVKRRLSIGDKMAGRHGNKGVISRIIPAEDMPYLADGTPVDVVLNPLGVPSRMNVGQVLETHLGFIAYGLGKKIDAMLQQAQSPENLKAFIKDIYQDEQFGQTLDRLTQEELFDYAKKLQKGVHVSTPVFDGASEQDMKRLMEMCGIDPQGKVQLFDGLTGSPFKQKVTIGYMYMLKLHHLVDEKIHARSIGPYSLVTQQPLGGKAHFGGQRFGEMEVWALEAYGAAYTLRELMTVKSDDVTGRNKIYESIVKGFTSDYTGIPESFKVLINELKSLCIEFKLLKEKRFEEIT